MTRREWVAAVDNCPKRKAKLTTFGAACDAIAADVRASKGSAIHRAPPEPQADSPCYYGHAYRAGKCTGCGREEPPPTFRGGIVHMDARTNTPDQVWRDGKPVDLCRNCSQPLAEPSPGCVDHEAIAAFIQASKARPE
jgi:ribosomal protein S27E